MERHTEVYFFSHLQVVIIYVSLSHTRVYIHTYTECLSFSFTHKHIYPYIRRLSRFLIYTQTHHYLYLWNDSQRMLEWGSTIKYTKVVPVFKKKELLQKMRRVNSVSSLRAQKMVESNFVRNPKLAHLIFQPFCFSRNLS